MASINAGSAENIRVHQTWNSSCEFAPLQTCCFAWCESAHSMLSPALLVSPAAFLRLRRQVLQANSYSGLSKPVEGSGRSLARHSEPCCRLLYAA